MGLVYVLSRGIVFCGVGVCGESVASLWRWGTFFGVEVWFVPLRYDLKCWDTVCGV